MWNSTFKIIKLLFKCSDIAVSCMKEDRGSVFTAEFLAPNTLMSLSNLLGNDLNSFILMSSFICSFIC